jgi:hypothetical protein
MKVAELHYIGAVYRRGRREALEDAAKVAENDCGLCCASCYEGDEIAKRIAAAIRALAKAEK